MSFRPTISYFLDGHIVDTYYHRNGDCMSLYMTAFYDAAKLDGCTSAEEVQRKNGRTGEVIDEDELLEIMDCTEHPIIVDLTARCIYYGLEALSADELETVPKVDPAEIQRAMKSNNLSYFRSRRIPFDMMDLGAAAKIMGED